MTIIIRNYRNNKTPQEIFEEEGIEFKCKYCIDYYMEGKRRCPKCGNKWDNE